MRVIVKINKLEEKQYRHDEEFPNWVYENINKTDKLVETDSECVGRRNELVRNKKEDATNSQNTDIKVIITT